MDYIQEIIDLCHDYTIGRKALTEDNYNELARMMDNHFCRFEKDCSNLVATNPYIISKLKAALEFFCLCAKDFEEDYIRETVEDGISFCTYYRAMQLKCRIFLDVINCFPSIRSLNKYNVGTSACVRWEPKDLQDALDFLDAPFEPQQSTGTPQESEIVLPPELDTEKARMVFQNALAAGYMEKQGNGYKWKESNASLAYVCGRLYCGDETKIDTRTKYAVLNVGCEYLPETPLFKMFGVDNLSQSRRQLKKRKSLNDLCEEFDKLFLSPNQEESI